MDDLEHHLRGNAALVEQRLAKGDLTEYPRPLDHMAYFPRKVAEKAIQDLVAAGFEVDSVKKGLRRTQVEFSRKDLADLDSANAVTRGIVEITSRHGGEYDGWAGFVLTKPPVE